MLSDRVATSAAMVLSAMTAGAIHADTISLKPHIIIGERDVEIRLSQIAELDGPEAERLADLVVLRRDIDTTAAESDQRLTVSQVREILTQSGAHWGRIDLQGSAVSIQVAGAAEHGPAAMLAVSLSPHSHAKPAEKTVPEQSPAPAEALVEEPTLRGELARLFCSKLHVEPRDLRITFASTDERVLSQSLDAARFEIQATSVFATDRATLVVRKWTDSKVEASWNITVRPEVRVGAAAMLTDVRKGHSIGEDDVELVETWLPAGKAATMASRDQVVGRIATTQVRSGEFVRRADVQRQALVQRGERIMVRCLVGGSVITMQAEARADGGEGDVIELRKIGERDTFYATVSGPRQAVVDLSRPIELPSERSPVAPGAPIAPSAEDHE